VVGSEQQHLVSHAEHFLSRLDRLAGAEVDVALQLYRDPDLVRLVLDTVKLPEAARRAPRKY
jgi:hypothetical protein